MKRLSIRVVLIAILVGVLALLGTAGATSHPVNCLKTPLPQLMADATTLGMTIITGTSGNDPINGTVADDEFIGYDRDDILMGRGGMIGCADSPVTMTCRAGPVPTRWTVVTAAIKSSGAVALTS